MPTLASLPKMRSIGWMPEFFPSWQAKPTQQAVGISAQPSAAFPTVAPRPAAALVASLIGA
jgi:hypothetical protein